MLSGFDTQPGDPHHLIARNRNVACPGESSSQDLDDGGDVDACRSRTDGGCLHLGSLESEENL